MLLKKAGSYHCASMASQMMRAQETMKKQGRAMWRIEDRSPTRSPRSAACLHPYSRDRALSACAKKRVNTGAATFTFTFICPLGMRTNKRATRRATAGSGTPPQVTDPGQVGRKHTLLPRTSDRY